MALVTPTHPSGEVWGPLIRHRALAAGEGSKQAPEVKLGVFSPRNGRGAEEGNFWWAPMVLPPSETFSAILTLEGPPQQGIGGIALLTLSDTEDSLHFLLLFRGLLESRSGGRQDEGVRVRRLGRTPASQRCTVHMCGHCRSSPGSLAAPDSPPGEGIERAPGQRLGTGE